MELILPGGDGKGKAGYPGLQSSALDGRINHTSVYKTFFKNLVPAGAIEVLPFPHKLKQSKSLGSDQPQNANLMLVYSSDYIWVYQICSELKNLNQINKHQEPLKLDLLCSHKTSNAIVSVNFLSMGVAPEMRSYFTVLYEDCKVATVHFDYELGAIETVVLHDLKNKDCDKLLGSSTAHHGSKPILKVQNVDEYSGFAVVRDSCIISFHLNKRAGRQLSIDGKLLNNRVLVLQKDFIEKPNVDMYSHSMYLDLRALDITNVSDFVYTFTQQEITIYLITSMLNRQQSLLKYQDKLLEVRLQKGSSLLKLMDQSLGKSEAISEKIAIKEDVRGFEFLPTVE